VAAKANPPKAKAASPRRLPNRAWAHRPKQRKQVKPPAEVTSAWESGVTVALLFVHDGGIDDELVQDTTETLSGFPGVTAFVVPASQIARYSAISGGAGVERVPALVVLTPKDVAKGAPTASVRYGFQSRQAVVQAVIDAGYQGPTLAYHP
jgi:hypothetical protein